MDFLNIIFGAIVGFCAATLWEDEHEIQAGVLFLAWIAYIVVQS